jgi:hypothetical protein
LSAEVFLLNVGPRLDSTRERTSDIRNRGLLSERAKEEENANLDFLAAKVFKVRGFFLWWVFLA